VKRLAVVALLFAAAPSFAQTRSPEELARIRAANRYEGIAWPRPTLSIAPRIGIAVGDMGVTYSVGAELAYAPGMLDKRLAFAIDAAWKPSSLDGQFSSYQLKVDEIAAAAAVTWHGYSGSAALIPFFAAGLGVSARSAATDFPGVGTRNEKEVVPAGFVSAGLAFRAGSGTVEVELRARYSPSQTVVLDGSSNSPFSLSAGYRFSLL
jgi:hypothetical protein